MENSATKIDDEIEYRDIEIAKIQLRSGAEYNYANSVDFYDRLRSVDGGPFFIETKIEEGEVAKYIGALSEDDMEALKRALRARAEGIELIEMDGDPLREILERDDYVAAGKGKLHDSRAYPLASADTEEENSDEGGIARKISREIGDSSVYLQIEIENDASIDVSRRRPRERAAARIRGAFKFAMGTVVEFIFLSEEKRANLDREETTRKEILLENARKKYGDEIAELMRRRFGDEDNFRVGVRALAAAPRRREAERDMRAVGEEIEATTRHPIVGQKVDLFDPTSALGSPDAAGYAQKVARREWRSRWRRLTTPSRSTFIIPRASELALLAHPYPDDDSESRAGSGSHDLGGDD